jgi:hypothetical protein
LLCGCRQLQGVYIGITGGGAAPSESKEDLVSAPKKPVQNAAQFAEATGLDQYKFRRWLRSQGTRVGRGKVHRLPADAASTEAKALVEAFNASQE